MDYDRTLNPSVLARCHRCEWWYTADDSEFPSKFIFDLAYQVCYGETLLRGIEPQGVVTADLRGNPLFIHDFTEAERPQIWQWFHARLNLQRDRLLESMNLEIQRDRQSRREATEETLLDLAWERRRN
ncbi:MAG: hypothetical protein JSS49_29800 [Planctomycetes bacterium]|nr:hypothetical protein [Planctomycetota bacterium]